MWSLLLIAALTPSSSRVIGRTSSTTSQLTTLRSYPSPRSLTRRFPLAPTAARSPSGATTATLTHLSSPSTPTVVLSRFSPQTTDWTASNSSSSSSAAPPTRSSHLQRPRTLTTSRFTSQVSAARTSSPRPLLPPPASQLSCGRSVKSPSLVPSQAMPTAETSTTVSREQHRHS